MISFSNVFADKRHVAPRLSLVNIQGLNTVLRSEIFISEDKQLRAVHLILNYEPLSNIFQDAGQSLRAGDPRLRRIDVSILGFLAHEDIMPTGIPLVPILPTAVASREETAS